MDTTKVFFSISDIKIVSARHILEEAGIPTFVIDKKDSSYPGMLGGKIELYVPKEDEKKAYKILFDAELIEV